MSITYGSCPEYPHDLGVLVSNWKIVVCEQNSERNIMSEDELNVIFSSKLKNSYCKGKVFNSIYINYLTQIFALSKIIECTFKFCHTFKKLSLFLDSSCR